MTLLGGSAVAVWPLAARAQQPAVPTIGILSGETSKLWASRMQAFRQGLSEAGFTEGKDVTIEYRWADDYSDRLAELAADLVRNQVAAIIVGGVPSVRAAIAATRTIPILFQIGVDPVTAGFVSSLNRPGNNVTGVANLSVELGPKRLELLHELVPSAGIIALLADPTNSSVSEAEIRSTQVAARQLGLELPLLHASSEQDFDPVFAALDNMKAGGLIITNTGLFNARSKQLGALSLRHAIPAIFQSRAFAASGGLMSYGTNIPEGFRQIGLYTGRILKGAKPAELPVLQPTKFEFVINLKTAKALGLTVPPTLVALADEVIE
ncbi:MAG: ABC transporter substrate-binding protein [Xanthobacteraceae bacterium]